MTRTRGRDQDGQSGWQHSRTCWPATVEVVESLSEVGGRLLTGPTKTDRRRVVPLPRILCELLGEHAGQYPSPAGYVFTAAQGGPDRHHNVMVRHFEPAVVPAGPPAAVRFHVRHTCAGC